MVKPMIVGYLLMLFSTVGFYLIFNTKFGYLLSMSMGMAAGSFLSFLVLVVLSEYQLKFVYFNFVHLIMLLMVGVLGYFSNVDAIFSKLVYYLVFASIFGVLVFKSGIITNRELKYVWGKLKRVGKHV